MEEFRREFVSKLATKNRVESRFVEAKAGVSQKKIAEAVVGFSNSEGGVILIGVRDDGSVPGARLTGEQERGLHESIANLHDPGRYKIREVQVGDTSVVAVSVSPREEGVAQTSDGRLLARRGASNQVLVGRELRDLMALRSLKRFERMQTEITVSETDGWRMKRRSPTRSCVSARDSAVRKRWPCLRGSLRAAALSAVASGAVRGTFGRAPSKPAC